MHFKYLQINSSDFLEENNNNNMSLFVLLQGNPGANGINGAKGAAVSFHIIHIK